MNPTVALRRKAARGGPCKSGHAGWTNNGNNGEESQADGAGVLQRMTRHPASGSPAPAGAATGLTV